MNSPTATINGITIRNHDKPYEAISPQRPELSQQGRTVLVCGGSAGIGHAIARNYCIAGASSVVILGRREDIATAAALKLHESYPNTVATARSCDVFNRDQSQKVWDDLEKEGIFIDVLVVNAVGEPALLPILDQGADRLWQDFENNVHAPLYLVERFYKQPGHTKQKFVISVSTQDIHRWDSAPQMPGYQLTKSSFATVMQQVARDTPEEKMRVISFHPSIVFTESARKTGYTEDTLPWTDENLPGGFAVWAASAEAQFLHGRFVWSTWDVNDLMSGELRDQIESDQWLLKVGAMRGCNTFQCLVYKPEDWTPQTNDEDFESKGKYFLSGLGDDMPSRDMAWPSVFPHRHDVDSPRADECIWNQDEADEYAMPFHPTCLEIYKRVSLKRNGVVDIQGLTLWWRRENTYDDFHHFPRDQDVNDAQEQWWSHDLGNEYLAANPCLIPGFQSLLQSCQNSDTTDFEPAGTTSPTHASTNDPFAKLPPEIQHSILVHLDFKDVANLRLTSRVFLQLPNSVLYELTVRNTPWLYEAWTSRPLSFWATTTQAELEEQWESTCDVLRSANPTMPVHQLSRTETNWLQLQIEISRNWGKLLGLRNRRRIWKDCEEILNRVDRIQAQDKTT
ncbi:unnamed protein product [Fusarium graminearum]|nr:unnamed protein product [Fusarium graminearum]